MSPATIRHSGAVMDDLLERARRIATEVVGPRAEQDDAEARWPEESMRALADAGLMGLNVPVELGGHGQGLAGLVAVSEVLARENPSLALCFAMHCVGTACIAAKATQRQREAYLVPIAEGKHITTLAASEPGSGSHFYFPETRLRHVEDGFRLSGTKSFITNGGHADSYVVSTVAHPDQDQGESGTFSMVLVDGGSDGMEWAAPWSGFGMRSNSSRTVELNDVFVEPWKLLGEEGDQLWYVFEVVAPYFLTAMAGTYSGVAVEAVEIARDHLGSRRHSHTGELLGSEPVLAHRLGTLWTETERTRRLISTAAEGADRADQDALVGILAAKLAAAETSVTVTNEAMTLVGGRGYRENSKLARLLRDARASHVMGPTTDVLKTWVGRALLGLPLL